MVWGVMEREKVKADGIFDMVHDKLKGHVDREADGRATLKKNKMQGTAVKKIVSKAPTTTPIPTAKVGRKKRVGHGNEQLDGGSKGHEKMVQSKEGGDSSSRKRVKAGEAMRRGYDGEKVVVVLQPRFLQ
jgi:hypothetical protein